MIEQKIGISLTSCDLCNVANEVSKVDSADFIHFDIMDGNFVNNLTFGTQMIKCLMRCTSMPFNVHLMVTKPIRYIKEIEEILRNTSSPKGYHSIAVHDASKDVMAAISQSGCIPGVVLSIDEKPSFQKCQYAKFIIIMTVPLGHGGQKFMDSQLSLISSAKKMFPDLLVGVDGGINDINAKKSIDAGADFLISGSYIFKHSDIKFAISSLRSALPSN